MRITNQMLDRIRDRLTDIDHAVIETLDRVGTASAGQLRRLHWPRPSQRRASRRRMQLLTGHRVIGRLDRRVGGVRAGSDGYVYRPDVAGRRLLNHPPGRRPHTPGQRFLDHSLAITEVYVRTVELSRIDLVELNHFETEPACWRSWGAGVLKPDAYMATTTPEFEDHWFIEVDRATESSSTIARKAGVYDRYHRTGIEQDRIGVFPRVLWIVPTDRRKSQLVETLGIRSADEWHLHQLVTVNEVPNVFKP